MRAGLQTPCTAFKGPRCIAAGELADVALKAKTAVDKGEQVLIFDDTTSESIEVDFRGSAEDVLRRLAQTDVFGAGQARDVRRVFQGLHAEPLLRTRGVVHHRKSGAVLRIA